MSNVAYLGDISSDASHSVKESQLKTYYDARNRIIWLYMKGSPRPAFTLKLLKEITSQIETVKQEMAESKGQKYDFLVLGSDLEGVFNLGGDLDLFCQLIRDNDKAGLLEYAKLSIDLVYQNLIHFGEDMSSMSLIQGDALGGGFEAAFSANVVVAERGCKCGLPEVLFNMFPGMGAFSILSRKIGFAAAEKMIMGGGIYSAEQLYELGLVDILAEPGEGEMAIYQHIKSTQRSRNSYRSMQQVKNIF